MEWLKGRKGEQICGEVLKTRLTEYHEKKPRFFRFVLWRLLGLTLFRIVPNAIRLAVLRVFGASIGKKCLIYASAKIYAPWNLKMADAVCFGPRVEVYNKGTITIGSGVVVSQDAYLCTASHDIADPRMRLVLKPIVIGDDVWIAAKATILPGVTVGEGAVVGACAVVAKDVSPWSVVVGNPARVVGERELKDD